MSTLRCDACGIRENPLLIDGKPSDGDFEGGDYDRMECIACYGPGYTMLSPDHARLSIVPAFAPLYAAWAEWDRLRGIVWG